MDKWIIGNGQLTMENCWLWCKHCYSFNKNWLLLYILIIIGWQAPTLANAALDGWIKEGEGWKYEEKGVFKTGWLKYKDKWFFLDEAGAMKNGWVKVKDKWYYLNDNGEMVSGWIKYKDKWYYLRENGAMATGWTNYNNQWYYLNPEGDMAFNTYIDGYWVDGDGVRKDSATEVNNGFKKVQKEDSLVSKKGSATQIHDTIKPTFKIIKVEDKDGNGCIDEVTIKFNKEVAINNVSNFYLEGGGLTSMCSGFYSDGINAKLKFDYHSYGEGNNVPMNSRDIKIINKNSQGTSIHEAPWIRKANTDIDGNSMEDGFTAYYR